MLIDFAGGDLDALAATQPVKAELSAHNGDVDNVTVQRLAENGIWRVSFRVHAEEQPGRGPALLSDSVWRSPDRDLDLSMDTVNAMARTRGERMAPPPGAVAPRAVLRPDVPDRAGRPGS